MVPYFKDWGTVRWHTETTWKDVTTILICFVGDCGGMKAMHALPVKDAR